MNKDSAPDGANQMASSTPPPENSGVIACDLITCANPEAETIGETLPEPDQPF